MLRGVAEGEKTCSWHTRATRLKQALAPAQGNSYKDRGCRWRFPNPKRIQGLVELAMELYNKGLENRDFEQPFMQLRF